mgnify:CR=1 FL=1
MDYAQALENIIRILFDVTYVPFLAAGVIVLTNLFKFVFDHAKVTINPALVALLVQVAVWVVYTIAVKQGFETQFADVWTALIGIIEAVLPLVLTLAAGHWGYEKAKAAGNPLLGYHKAA